MMWVSLALKGVTGKPIASSRCQICKGDHLQVQSTHVYALKLEVS